ncbi:OLC1v1014480C1 [Oldenlandia corymbosa var. corymbosa]|uniref:OLC1v1014480C1 n=1 Tax=Oldenlandia corymbosa var. corymbosa TaxID=529605 RepID=A0AAV1E438_OLDCO|nr:OLC1v1014480C1 [Oldenlandia corymbosa var. corymbosa]
MVRAKSSQESKPRRRNSVKRPAQEAVAASDGKEEEKIDGERKEKKPRRSTSSSSSRITRQRTNSSRSSRKLVKSPGQEGTVSNGKEELGLDGERKKKPRVDDDKIHCDICLDFKTDDQIFKIDSALSNFAMLVERLGRPFMIRNALRGGLRLEIVMCPREGQYELEQIQYPAAV